MNDKKHIAIYSHGFAVRRDDRGLFTDIAAGLPGVESIMFDYSPYDEAANTITATPFDEQVEKLHQVYKDARANNPDAIIDLICHSQGCIVAAMARLEGVRKTVFLAPPDQNFGLGRIEEKIQAIRKQPGTVMDNDGTLRFPRRDGTTTIVPPNYWQSRQGINATKLYQELAGHTKLIIITATEDEILGEVVFDDLSPRIKVFKMATGHSFEGEGRIKLIALVAGELGIGKPRIIVVNEQDEIIGHKERGTLTKEDIYRVSALWITNSKGDILLAQRKFTKSHDPGKWGPAVAGTNDEGETYESNILKEAKEEIGLKDITPIPGPKIRVRGEHNYFDQWYTFSIDKPAEDFTIQEDEVEQVKWFTRDELEEELQEHPENYLKGIGWCLENL